MVEVLGPDAAGPPRHRAGNATDGKTIIVSRFCEASYGDGRVLQGNQVEQGSVGKSTARLTRLLIADCSESYVLLGRPPMLASRFSSEYQMVPCGCCTHSHLNSVRLGSSFHREIGRVK